MTSFEKQPGHISVCRLGVCCIALFLIGHMKVMAQVKQTSLSDYGNVSSLGVFGEYSDTSSHILIGEARNRKLFDLGVSYSHQLAHIGGTSLQYMGELRPVMLESDPITDQTNVEISPPPAVTYINNGPLAQACHPSATTYTSVSQGVIHTDEFTESCPGRRWTYGAGMSPVGFKWNFLVRSRFQPIFTGLAGMMFSTQQIPVNDASSWNFTFEFGAGVEYFRSSNRSIRAEWRFHHISNDFTARENPGIDSGLFQLTYSFGR